MVTADSLFYRISICPESDQCIFTFKNEAVKVCHLKSKSEAPIRLFILGTQTLFREYVVRSWHASERRNVRRFTDPSLAIGYPVIIT